MQRLSTCEESWWERFQSLLDDQIDFPDEYVFKFIVPASNLNALRQVFGAIPVTERRSSKGTYVSVTATIEVHSSDEVIALYKAAGRVDQVMML